MYVRMWAVHMPMEGCDEASKQTWRKKTEMKKKVKQDETWGIGWKKEAKRAKKDVLMS